MSEGPLLWYLNRATGLTLLVLLTASVVLGVLSTGSRPGRGLPVFVTQHLHRNVALLSVVALVVHVLTAVGRRASSTSVGGRRCIPFGATYEPLWLGLGALSLDLIVVVVVTSALRTRLSHRAWRSVHYASWVAWVCALAHTPGHRHRCRERPSSGRWRRPRPASSRCASRAGLRLSRSQEPSSPSRPGGTTMNAPPVPYPDEIRVHPGPALLAGIEHGPSLTAHRQQYGDLSWVDVDTLLDW